MIDPDVMDRDTQHRLIEGALVFFEQVGAEPVVDDEEPEPVVDDEEPKPASFRCPVCGAVNDWPGCCSADCYRAWNAPPDDPRDYIDAY